MNTTSLQLYGYNGFEVRTQLIDGEAWFVLNDLCRVLEISNPRMVRDRLNEDDVSLTDVMDSLGRKQSTTIVNESGMYEVIIRSDKPEAKAFRRWLTSEVIPEIRRTGSYGTPALDLNALDPRTLALAILEESDRADAAEKKLAIAAPKAEAFQQFIESDGSLSMGAVANMYKVGRQTLFDWLKMAKVIQPDRRPYQEYAHWFEVKATTFERSSGMSGVSYSSKLLPAGVDPLYKLLVRRDYIKPGAVA